MMEIITKYLQIITKPLAMYKRRWLPHLTVLFKRIGSLSGKRKCEDLLSKQMIFLSVIKMLFVFFMRYIISTIFICLAWGRSLQTLRHLLLYQLSQGMIYIPNTSVKPSKINGNNPLYKHLHITQTYHSLSGQTYFVYLWNKEQHSY